MKLLIFNWDTDKVVSWSALAVAVCSMFVTYMELSTNREHQRLSVKPIVEFYRNSSSGESGYKISYLLANTGLGPARVGHFEVHVDGERVRTYAEIKKRILDEFSLSEKDTVTNINTSDIWQGRIIKPEQEVHFLSFEEGQFAKHAFNYFQKHPLSIKICYCSLYNECETFDPYVQKREAVPKCQWDKERAFIRYDENQK